MGSCPSGYYTCRNKAFKPDSYYLLGLSSSGLAAPANSGAELSMFKVLQDLIPVSK
jgi:hypothetical protein